MFSGLIRCKECNSFMTPSHTNKKNKGTSKKYNYYRCTSTLKKDLCRSFALNDTGGRVQAAAGKDNNQLYDNKITAINGRLDSCEGSIWLAIVHIVRTNLLSASGDIFIPEMSF